MDRLSTYHIHQEDLMPQLPLYPPITMMDLEILIFKAYIVIGTLENNIGRNIILEPTIQPLKFAALMCFIFMNVQFSDIFDSHAYGFLVSAVMNFVFHELYVWINTNVPSVIQSRDYSDMP
ncbi:hypothetical protein CDAR_276421 [Caerostris darwini]|uniref:Uncharacterized protein n=1 Tax=Caerostris darwini TaxID=1538125 RepID=A0AAV4QG27_9ARAC|nr:hypothetical protein CDAR_276421 [Caerostris darwini]